MSSQANKDLVVKFVDEFWSKGNFGAADQLMTDDVVIHEPQVGDVAGLKAFAKSLRSAFPDWHSTPEEMVAEEDMVVERWTGRGTQKGEFMGNAASGKQVEVPGVVFYRVRDGKISEFRGSFDRLSMLEQIGN